MSNKENQAYVYHPGAYAAEFNNEESMTERAEPVRRMTFREKLQKEHPERIDDESPGGCQSCPDTYGYEPYRLTTACGCKTNEEQDRVCRACWDRKLPPEHPATIPLKKVGETADRLAASLIETANRILDSGERTEFPTGAVRDMREGKGRCDLMPLHVVSRHLKDVVLHEIAQFQSHNDVDYLYRCLGVFSEHWDDGKTKHNRDEITNQRLASMYLEVAKQFEDGAKKYGENNWQKGIPAYCYIDSAIRHYLKWLRGDRDEPHDRAFVWNIMCCIWEVGYHNQDDKERK